MIEEAQRYFKLSIEIGSVGPIEIRPYLRCIVKKLIGDNPLCDVAGVKITPHSLFKLSYSLSNRIHLEPYLILIPDGPSIISHLSSDYVFSHYRPYQAE